METEKFRSKLSISIPSSRSYRIYVSRYSDFSSILRNEIYKKDNKIVEIFFHAISSSIPRLFFLEKLSRELSIYLRRIFANLRSVLIRGNRLPVKVISSDDGKTDFSLNWHHSRRGGNTRVRSTTNWDATCTTCPSGRGLRRLGRQRCFRAPLWWPVAQAHPAPRNLTAGGPAPV